MKKNVPAWESHYKNSEILTWKNLGRTNYWKKKFVSVFCFLQLQITELEKIIIKE